MNRVKSDLLSGVTEEVFKSKKIANNTLEIAYKDGRKSVRYHDTDIITRYPDGSVKLDTDNHLTVSTKERLNTYSPFSISQHKGLWTVDTTKGSFPYYDDITFNDQGDCISGVRAVDTDRKKRLEKLLREYLKELKDNPLPVPNNGDCFICRLDDKVRSTDCLENHLEERYIHGSLIVNALRDTGFSDNQIGIYYHLQSTIKDTVIRSVRRYFKKYLINSANLTTEGGI